MNRREFFARFGALVPVQFSPPPAKSEARVALNGLKASVALGYDDFENQTIGVLDAIVDALDHSQGRNL